MDFYKNKKVLITDAAGTVGREIVRQLYPLKPAELRLMDNNETKMFFLMEEYKNKDVYCFIGDVRDKDKVEKLSDGIDVIIHCAVFKKKSIEMQGRKTLGSHTKDDGFNLTTIKVSEKN